MHSSGKKNRNADKPNEKDERYFYDMMKKIGREMHECTGAFRVKSTSQPHILDMCMAPGGFLATALNRNPGCKAVGFSLPISQGGHKLRLVDSRVTVKILDLTMLAADMGVTDKEVPAEHTDAHNFHLTSQFENGVVFDLVLCDGNVLHLRDQPAIRAHEARRLRLSQLVLALERVREGGTMVVLLHKVDGWDSVQMLYTFRQFSRVRVFKPRMGHAKQSSFYMVAMDIRVGCLECVRAIERWKALWKVATFGTEERYLEVESMDEPDVHTVLREFGPELARLGKEAWKIQAEALEQAPFIKRR